MTSCLEEPNDDWGVAEGCLGLIPEDAGSTMEAISSCAFDPGLPCLEAAIRCTSDAGPACPAADSGSVLGQSCAPLGTTCVYGAWNDATGCSLSGITCSPPDAGDAGSGIWTAAPNP
jgi:hypothetical protein